MTNKLTYNKQRDLVILLSNTGSMLSKTIRACTKTPFTHVSIGFDLTLTELYSFGRKTPRNPVYGGLVIENYKAGTFARFPDTDCAVYTLRVNESTFNNTKRIINEFLQDKDRYGYNILGLIGAKFNIPVNRRYYYFCSQFVAAVLEKGGIQISAKPPALVIPYDFAASKNLQLIYTGRLSEYCINQIQDVV